jgi:hypothetical protein
VQVGEHDVLASADTSSYRLSDRSRANDNYGLVHSFFPAGAHVFADERAFCSVVSTA